MPETQKIVINTGPLLALIAGYGDLSLLEKLYRNVLVPFEVYREIEAGGDSSFGIDEFRKADFIEKEPCPLPIAPYLSNSLDLGEAAVIQLAINKNIDTVCIDEAVGRRAGFGKKDRFLSEKSALMSAQNMRQTRRAANETIQTQSCSTLQGQGGVSGPARRPDPIGTIPAV